MRDLLKPEYLWRPSQVLRRLLFKPAIGITKLSLPWNCTISACSADSIGGSIGTQGVYDLPLTEAILRLTDPGDTGLDVGANVGYMSLVIARAAGTRGRVICFEPNREIIPILCQNVKDWATLGVAPIEVKTFALSELDGEASLGIPAEYEGNKGVASLEISENGSPVTVHRLDSTVSTAVGLMKIDVEGHEAAVLGGAEKLLARGLIRDILFEEHATYPAKSHKLLQQYGYHVFRVARSMWRPLLLPPEAPSPQSYLPSNFLATTNPSRALLRFQAWGWYALHRGLRQNAFGTQLASTVGSSIK